MRRSTRGSRAGCEYWGWPAWPERLRDPRSAEARVCATERLEVDFHAWLQWVADEQLGAAQLARDLGMAIGLYGDYAVGVDPTGLTWNQRAYWMAAGVALHLTRSRRRADRGIRRRTRRRPRLTCTGVPAAHRSQHAAVRRAGSIT
jgi:hypothetical protein